MDLPTLLSGIQRMITAGKGDIHPTELIDKLFSFACVHLPPTEFVDALIRITEMVYDHYDGKVDCVHLPMVEFIVDHSIGKYSSSHLIKEMVKYKMGEGDKTLSHKSLVINVTYIVLARS